MTRGDQRLVIQVHGDLVGKQRATLQHDVDVSLSRHLPLGLGVFDAVGIHLHGVPQSLQPVQVLPKVVGGVA
ncbi:MAG: hypothetical protein MUO38_09490 [Anaerolineales bacterium]|nr:hypothetical protein [Anaerolineales bacterium]